MFNSTENNFLQIQLNFWRQDYENDWIIGDSNEVATNIALHTNGHIYLQGPRFSGKKHLASKIATIHQCHVFFLEFMQEIEIIDYYDFLKTDFDRQNFNYHVEEKKYKAIWVAHNNRTHSTDVASRLNAMHNAIIEELSEDMFFALLSLRLSSLGFAIKNEIINYCITRLPRTYEIVEKCVKLVKKNNKINLTMFKDLI